jgi:hypothetical protein
MQPFGRYGIEPAVPAIPYRCAASERRSDEALALEPFQRRLNRPGWDVPLQSFSDFVKNRAAVGPIVKSKNRQQNRLLEGSKSVCH